MELLNLAFCGVHTLNSTVDYTTLMRNLVTSFCFALGLNCNLPVGRMDTSTGSQMYLACIIGGNIALSLNLGGVGVLVFSMLFGMLAGGFVGFLFINMRILPMVLGLGISLVYECISFSMYNQQGLNLFGKPGVSILSNWGFIIVVTLLVMLVMTYLFQYSGFGYNRRAIQGKDVYKRQHIFREGIMCRLSRMWLHQDWLSPVQIPPYRCIPMQAEREYIKMRLSGSSCSKASPAARVML